MAAVDDIPGFDLVRVDHIGVPASHDCYPLSRFRDPKADRERSCLTRSQESAMSFFKNLSGYLEVAIVVVLGLAALAGIIRFIILADIF
jgi:hypothetical protein